MRIPFNVLEDIADGLRRDALTAGPEWRGSFLLFPDMLSRETVEETKLVLGLRRVIDGELASVDFNLPNDPARVALCGRLLEVLLGHEIDGIGRIKVVHMNDNSLVVMRVP